MQDIQNSLNNVNATLHIFHKEVHFVFKKLAEVYYINTIFSHEETGTKLTFERDLKIQKYCNENNIIWKEYQTNGIIRKLKNRNNWDKRWNETMHTFPKSFDLKKGNFLDLEITFYHSIKGENLPEEIAKRDKNFQQGGEYWAWRYLDSFIKERYTNYSRHISKPELSRKGCSRLSPYLAYGNISMRMVYQYTIQH